MDEKELEVLLAIVQRAGMSEVLGTLATYAAGVGARFKYENETSVAPYRAWLTVRDGCYEGMMALRKTGQK